jgi:hypothetical protein
MAILDVVINLKDYGAKGNNSTNDTGALINALNYIKAQGGGTLIVPKGIYKLSTWTTQTIDYPLTIIGTEHSSFVGGSSSVNLFSITANFSVENLSVDGFQDMFDFSSVTTMLDYIKINNVRCTNCSRACVRWTEPLSKIGGVKRMYIHNSRFEGITTKPKYGLHLETPMFQHMDIIGNTIEGIVLKGIYIGTTNLALQDLRENVNISFNNVGNMYNSYGSAVGEEDYNLSTGEGKRSCNGIQVFTTNASIQNNYIYDLDNWSKQDCEGIYTKCKYAIISNNHLVNAGGGEAFIDIKGNGRLNSPLATCTAQTSVTVLNVTGVGYGLQVGDTIDIWDNTDTLKYGARKITAMSITSGSGTITINGTAVTTVATDYIAKTGKSRGYGVICTGNTLVDNRPFDPTPIPSGTDPFVSTGIKINNQDVRVEHNLIEGMTFNAIYVGGSDYRNLSIKNNKIRKIRGWGGISVGGLGVNFEVSGNQIIEILTENTTTNTPYGIQVAGSVDNVIISDNQIDTVPNGASSATAGGIVIAPNAVQAVVNVIIRNNSISNTVRGIYFKSNPTDDVWMYNNRIQGVTVPVYYGTVAPTNLVIGTNNPSLAMPTPTDPSAITGLKTWFKADSLVLADGAAISTWTDSAGTANVVQATGANQPTYQASALNGKPAVVFNGTTQNLKTAAAWATASSQPNTIFVVAQLTSGYLFDGFSTAGRQYLRNSGSGFVFNSGNSLSVNQDSNFHIFVLRANGTGVQGSIKVDTITTLGDPSGATPTALNGLTIGSLNNATGVATGKLCEIIVFNGSLSNYDQAQMEYYLKTKYGL